MPRLVSVTITVHACDDTDTGALAEAMFNTAEAGTEDWADANGWEVEFLDADVTLNVEAEE